MFGEMLRTYLLGAVVCLILGIGIGFGWHFVERAAGRPAASAATPHANQDAPNPPSPTAAAQRETPALGKVNSHVGVDHFVPAGVAGFIGLLAIGADPEKSRTYGFPP